jgi:chromate transport protein ChrA
LKSLACRLTSAIEGLTTEEAALYLALGLALGTFPLPGLPTLLCVLAAAALRLNFPSLQLVNHLSSPLQIALLIPYASVGSRILGSQTTPKWGGLVLGAIAGWFCMTVPAAILLYFALVYAVRKRRRRCFNRLESPA